MIYLNILLDVALIGLLLVGISYAVKLTKQLSQMRESRLDMERFVFDFNSSVARAENGIKNLKNTARTSGDDLEKLIEKGQMLRDELQFLTESADLIANRLSSSASQMTRTAETESQSKQENRPVQAQGKTETSAKPQALVQEIRSALSTSGKTPSNAERELLRALEKLG